MRQRRMYSIAEDEREFEGEAIPFRVPVHSLFENQEEYANIPDFQRDTHIWPERYEYEFIKTLCLKGYVPPILVCKRFDGKPGMWIIDGQQRMSTLLRFVEALKADLAGKPIPKDDNGYYFYFRISPKHQQTLLNSKLRFEELQNPTPELIARTFLALQNQVSATTAEKMWASTSAINKVIKDVYTFSPFFNDFYEGRAKKKARRKQTYQMASYPVLIELFKPFGEMNGTQLQMQLDGRRDYAVYDGMEDIVINNLALVSKLFEGVKIGAMSEAIIMYQAVWLLKFIGCDLEATQPGALTPWYRTIEKLNYDSRAAGFLNLFAMIVKRKTQQHYWRSWIEDIVYGNKVVGADNNEVMAAMQRLTGWLRHDGICPECHNPHVQLRDIDVHLFRPADRYRAGICTNTFNKKIVPSQSLVVVAQ